MFGVMHFIYCIKRLLATKVDSTCYSYQQTKPTVYNLYVHCYSTVTTCRCTRDIEITSPMLRHLV